MLQGDSLAASLTEHEDYELLNAALNAVFFDGRNQSRPVYLDLEEEPAAETAEMLGLEAKDLELFIGLAVTETLKGPSTDPYAWHVARARRWARDGRVSPPPFTGLLVALSFAAEKMRGDGQFSATNYYERLFEVLDLKDDGLKNKLRFHARSTRLFWRELNHWLTENDFELGRPTARQVNSWAYVSYALSQALVREEERLRFHHLFKEFDLSPLDDVSESEMVLFLHDWMTGSGPNAWLRKLWASPDLRERVAAAALTELENWDGGQIEGGRKKRRLSWTAYFKTFPRRRLELLLATVAPEERDELKLEQPAGTSRAASQAFEEAGGNLRLAQVPTGEFSVLEPTSQIDLGALLLASFELEGGTGEAFTHVARPIVPLAKLDTGIYYREVQRVTLLRRHAVLCHEQWVPMTKGHLAKCARPGFKFYQHGELPGLPPSWALFDDVEITRVLEDASTNMAVLVPLSEGVAIQLEGGLRLAPQIWHSRARPTVLATSDNGGFDLVVRSHGADSDEEVFKQRSRGGSCSLDLATLGEDLALELTAVAARQSKEMGERNFALRDASLPRSVRGSNLAYALCAKNPAAFLGAHGAGQPDTGTCLAQGMVIDDADLQVIARATSSPAELGEFVELEAEQDEPSHEYMLKTVEGLAETCMIRGYHYWIVEEAKKGDIPWEAKRMECKDCKMNVVLRNRIRRKQGSTTAGRRGPSLPVAAPPIDRSAKGISLDLVFDGLCYLGAGTWATFQSLASAHSEDRWFASALGQDLHDLGHVDFARDGAGRVTGWSVAPPALVVKPCGEAFLAGFRNDGLVDAIGDALERFDCDYEPGEPGRGPSRQAWRGVDVDLAREALQDTRDPHGRAVRVVTPPAHAIASLGCTVGQLLDAGALVHLESKDDLQRFDARKGRWEFTASTSEVGAYRTNFAGRRYFVRREDGSCRAASHSLAKIFAARTAGIALHGYDEARRRFFGVLGCDLPGLYSRALVSCSGQLPARDGRRFFHEDVPPAVAGQVLSKLYGNK